MLFSDIARIIDSGKMLPKNLTMSKAERSIPAEAVAGGSASSRPVPGWNRVTSSSPSES
jgi:hypothetical protein